MAANDMTGICAKWRIVTLELAALLGQQLRLDSDGRGEKFEICEDPLALTLIFSETGRRYELLLSNSFIELYPSYLCADVRRALTYLGEYVRCTEHHRLLLTGYHVYEEWDDNTLAD